MSQNVQHLGERRFHEPPVIVDGQLAGSSALLRGALWLSAGLLLATAALLAVLR